MTTALQDKPTEGPKIVSKATGLRELPHLNVSYYARAPKVNPFSTVWLPVNASKRSIEDKKQDIMHLYYSKHLHGEVLSSPTLGKFNLDVNFKIPPEHENKSEFVMQPKKEPKQPDSVKAALWMTNENSVAPFVSLGKPTCGFYFSYKTDHKKRLTGIPPTNTVKWRSQKHS